MEMLLAGSLAGLSREKGGQTKMHHARAEKKSK